MKNLIFVIILLFSFSCKKETTEPIGNILTVERFKEGITSDNIQLIDVRTAEEYFEGHIDEAQHMDILELEEFETQIQSLDKSKPIYLYCRSGNRSQKAAEILKKEGFIEINDLKGGYQAWAEQN